MSVPDNKLEHPDIYKKQIPEIENAIKLLRQAEKGQVGIIYDIKKKKGENMENVVKFLESVGACNEAVVWIKTQKNWKTALKNCERADWLLWLAGKMVDKKKWNTKKQIVWTACQCARLSLKYIPKNELRPLKAIEAAEMWTRNDATIEVVREAAYAAAYAVNAVNAAAYAVNAAAYAATYAANAAAYAVNAAAYAAYTANAANAVKLKTHKTMCKIIRKNLRFPEPKI